jgi:TPR repeat protein
VFALRELETYGRELGDKPMSNSRPTRRQPVNPELIFRRADEKWSRGELRPALKLFLQAAKNGDRAAQLNVGYFYDRGIGVRRNREEALYWYKRAYRRGDASAAANIGTIWRDAGESRRALSWFKKAVRLGDDGGNLEIARIYLGRGDRRQAASYLDRICQSNRLSEDEMKQAKRLLVRVRTRAETV